MDNQLFNIHQGKLFYDNKAFLGANKAPLFTNYEFLSSLGEGANGITFLVRHKFLQVKQVLKIYADTISYDKAVNEIRKNALLQLQSINAVNYDGGEIWAPFHSCYAIMEIVEGHTTLKNWISSRDHFYESLDPQGPDFKTIEEFTYSATLNMAVSLLKTIVLKNETTIVHGDLNDNNILVYNIFEHFSTENGNDCNNEAQLAFTNKHRTSRIGTLNEFSNKLIDMGTSQVEGTDKAYGQAREAWFIFDNLRKLLKPFFVTTKLNYKELFHFTVDTKKKKLSTVAGTAVNYEILTNDFVRLILLFNFMLGLLYNWDGKLDLFATLGKNSDARWINIFVSEDFTELLLPEICDASLMYSLSLAAKKSKNSYLDWNKVWQYFGQRFPNSGLEQYIFRPGNYGMAIHRK
jgi:serine/threonine protein kinase